MACGPHAVDVIGSVGSIGVEEPAILWVCYLRQEFLSFPLKVAAKHIVESGRAVWRIARRFRGQNTAAPASFAGRI